MFSRRFISVKKRAQDACFQIVGQGQAAGRHAGQRLAIFGDEIA